MKINKYPDGTSYINGTILGEQVFRINNYEDLWHLNQFVDAFHSQHDSITVNMRPNIIIPCLIDAQADRRFNRGESFGLKLILKFLGELDANFKVFHPHNSEVIEMSTNNIQIIDNSDFIKAILSRVEHEFHKEYPASYNFVDETILISPDGGSYKWIMKLCDKIDWKGEVYCASKSRKYEEGKSKLVQLIDREDFNGKDCIITDDMCLFGGTFIGLAKMLKERNVGKLYLAVSHLTVEKPNPELFTLFDKVFTTNSKYDEYFPIPHKDGGGASKAENLEVIKLF